jgi:hypothetical protein
MDVKKPFSEIYADFLKLARPSLVSAPPVSSVKLGRDIHANQYTVID